MDKKTVKLLDKVSKLLAMAERSKGNEAEAAVAQRQVEALMKKHNLTLADITPEQAKSDCSDTPYKGMKWTAGKCPVWVNVVAIALADYYDCHVSFVAASSNDSHVAKTQCHLNFIGVGADSVVCMEMFVYLYNTTNRLCDEFAAKNPAPAGTSRTYKNNFRLGMADRLRTRLKELKASEEEVVTSTGTGLMVVKSNAIAEHLGHKPGYTTNRRTSQNHAAARSAGHTAGGSVALKTQLK